jgi:FAD/FMN-containing dehydrogenase
MGEFIAKLKQKFKGEIADDLGTLNQYSHDASLFEIKPKLVVAPKTVEDVENLVMLVEAENAKGGRRLSLTVRSAGTDMTGGPLSESIVVDMSRYFSKIKQIGADYAVVQPGVFYRDFEKETLKHDLLLPSYPASRELCTVGGMVANNSGGEKTLIYGKTADYVEELKMVLRDGYEYSFRPLTFAELERKKKLNTVEGEIYQQLSELVEHNDEVLRMAKPKVSKNSAGYALWDVWDKEHGQFDPTRVLVGSQGTFGIITEIKFRLIKPDTQSRLLVVFLKDLQILPQLINHVLSFHPDSFESYDDHTFHVAMKVFPEIAKRLKGNLLTLAFQFLPEFWATLIGGIPKMVLLIEFTGNDSAEVQKRAFAAQASLAEFKLKTKVTSTTAEAEKYWVVRRESFNLLRHHVAGLRTAPFIDDLIVRPERLPEFLPKLYALLDQYDIIYTVAGHVGDGNFHIIPLMNLHDPKARNIILELGKKVYQLVFEFHGSITGEHNDGLIRTPYLEQMFGKAVLQLFEQTKDIFDPENIFNPGKKVRGSMDYAMAHLNTA